MAVLVRTHQVVLTLLVKTKRGKSSFNGSLALNAIAIAFLFKRNAVPLCRFCCIFLGGLFFIGEQANAE